MTEQMNVPKLRFAEFDGCWTNSSMRDISKINQGLQIPISERYTELKEGRYFYITNEFLRPSSTTKYYIENPSDRVICEERDILMTRTGNTGQVVTDIAGVFHNNFFKIDYSNNVDKHFLVEFLRLSTTQSMILRYAGTSTIPDLNHGDFYRIKLALPELPEQQKIASFLSKVDEKIALLTEKKDKLTEYKKGVMQQLFNGSFQEQDGQLTFIPPTLRFKADDGSEFPDWEERKLGELGQFKNGLNKGKEDFGFGSPFVNLQDVFGKQVISSTSNLGLVNASDKDIDLYQLLKGDVIFIRSSVKKSGVGETALVEKNLVKTVYSGFLIRFRSNTDLTDNYKKYCFWEKRFRNKLIAMSTTSANTNINQESLSQLTIPCPSQDEQTKIANFLSSIDQKIDLVSSELEKTKEWKKGLLQQMFV
ncbi:TPA: restriction endonuclease subunit S [Vibrio harveyi]